jgi:transposase
VVVIGCPIARPVWRVSGGEAGIGPVELSVVEQRYRAVLAVQAGEPAVAVAAQWGVSRQTVQNWLCRYREGGLAGLADRSRRPHGCLGQTGSEVEAVICELRREHPRWGARRIAHELICAGTSSVPSWVTVHRVVCAFGREDRNSYRPVHGYGKNESLQ